MIDVIGPYRLSYGSINQKQHITALRKKRLNQQNQPVCIEAFLNLTAESLSRLAGLNDKCGVT